MIKPEQVPEAAADAARELGVSRWVARDVVAAVLNAWPGMHTHEWQRPWLGGMSGTDLILPLPQQEKQDG